MNNIFTEHPAGIGETYMQHLKIASWTGLQMMFAGFACFIHAFLPFLFMHTASDSLFKLSRQFEIRAMRRDERKAEDNVS